MKRQDASTGKMIDDGKAAEQSGEPTMQVKVYSPFHIYFDEAAASISGSNATGPFDILPRHHNFISLLSAGELAIRRTIDDEPQRIKISGGIMHVRADRVRVFLNI